MQRVIAIIAFVGASILSASSQKVVSLEEAIDLALKNNYGIRITKNNVQEARNNASRGNAGLLPEISGNGNLTYNQTEDTRSNADAETYSFGAGIQLDYTLYESGARKSKYQLLKTQLKEQQLGERELIENTILEISDRYLSAATALEKIQSQQQSLNISRERLKLANIQNEYGGNNRLDILNAQVDFNKDSLELINLMHDYQEEKYHLFELISSEWDYTDFRVNAGQEAYTVFDIESLVNEALEKNVELLKQSNLIQQGEQNYKIIKAGLLPKVSLQSSYDFSRNDDPFYRTNQMQTGVNVSIPIFKGRQERIKLKNVRIQNENQKLSLDKERLRIEKEVRILWQTYKNQLQNILFEETNLKAANLNLSVSKEMLKNGQISNTQFREAQLNLVQVQTNLSSARHTAKNIEYQLLKYSGRLVY